MAKKTPNKQKKRKSNKAVLPILCALILIGAIATALWLKSETDSKLANSLRQLLGMAAEEEVIEPVVVAPEPIIEPTPAPAPPPPPPPPPPPEPKQLSFQDLVRMRTLWPSTLQLTGKVDLEIRFNDSLYGHVSFLQGDLLEVKSINESGHIIGTVSGSSISAPVDQTNLEAWFKQTHAADYTVDFTKTPKFQTDTAFAPTEAAFTKELQKWCNQRYGDCIFEVKENSLLLSFNGSTEEFISLNLEAEIIALEYLQRQSHIPDADNYAFCEIRDYKTNKLLGSASIYMPFNN